MSTTGSAARVMKLAKDIFGSLFPHQELPKEPLRRSHANDLPAPENKLTAVESSADVTEGDLVLVIELDPQKPYVNFGDRYTARELATSSSLGYIARVNRATDKSLYVSAPVHSPHRIDADPTLLGQDIPGAQESRLSFGATNREILRLGNALDLRHRTARHPDFAAWIEVYGASQAEAEQRLAARRARQEAAEAEFEKKQEIADRLHALTGGESLISVRKSFLGGAGVKVEAACDWLDNQTRLRVYVTGMLHVARRPDDIPEALDLLHRLGY